MRLISAPAAAPSSHLQAFSAPQWTVVGVAGVCLEGQCSLKAHTANVALRSMISFVFYQTQEG